MLELPAGSTVISHTLDAHGHDHNGQRLVPFSNPLTGPFAVAGAHTGDTLTVHFERIQPIGEHGWSYLEPRPGVLEPGFPGLSTRRREIEWHLGPSPTEVHPARPDPSLPDFSLPTSPMLGCVGVAPALGEFISSYDCEAFGGNLDCPLITAGCTIELPVSVPGGLLFLGDCHAVQSDGEITGAAVEMPAEIEFTLGLEKGRSIRWPHGLTDEILFTIACGRPLDQALQHATSEMYRWLTDTFHLDADAAWLAMGQAVSYRICNVVSPHYSIACILPRHLLAGRTPP